MIRKQSIQNLSPKPTGKGGERVTAQVLGEILVLNCYRDHSLIGRWCMDTETGRYLTWTVDPVAWRADTGEWAERKLMTVFGYTPNSWTEEAVLYCLPGNVRHPGAGKTEERPERGSCPGVSEVWKKGHLYRKKEDGGLAGPMSCASDDGGQGTCGQNHRCPDQLGSGREVCQTVRGNPGRNLRPLEETWSEILLCSVP